MGEKVLLEDDGEELMEDGSESEDAPEFEDFTDEERVAGAEVFEGVKDGDVESEDLA